MTTPTRSTTKSAPFGREGPQPWRHDLLANQRTRDRQGRHDHQKPADEHGQAQVTLYHSVLALSPAKAEPLFPAALL